MSTQPDRHAPPGALPSLHTIGDVRAALRQGRGFPGDRENFEKDLDHALNISTETDLRAVAEVIRDYRGRILLHSDPDFEAALAEGVDLSRRLKAGDQETSR
ncbi:DUF6247 family protein [Streptomyces sp. NPDC054841]